ncbi:hypothetical protein MKW92_014494 [Papaver armeniacum]|nr:hypothetical protein MKW92_014494 [Papaver armeniacum]
MGERMIQMLAEKKKIRHDDDNEEEERAVKNKEISKTIKVYSRRKIIKEENKSMDLLDDGVVSAEETIGNQKSSKSVDQKSAMEMNEGDGRRRSSRIEMLATKKKIRYDNDDDDYDYEEQQRAIKRNKISKTTNKIDSRKNNNGYAKVQDTISAFNKHYLHFIQKEELRCKRTKEALKNKGALDAFQAPLGSFLRKFFLKLLK